MRCPDCGHEITGEVCLYCSVSIKPEIKQNNLDNKTIERISSYDNDIYSRYTSKFELHKAINTLVGILKGINIDGIINQVELDELKNWCEVNNKFSHKHPFSELIPTIIKAIEDNHIDIEEMADIRWVCFNIIDDSIYKNIVTTDIIQLQGILHGILSDNQITFEEISGLKSWLLENTQLATTYPYDELYSLTSTVLQDGILDSEEKRLLKAFFVDFIDSEHTRNVDYTDIKELKRNMSKFGICATSPNITLPEKTFCFTGKSSKTSRSGFANIITALGGLYKDSVAKTTDYLVIGNEGNPCWTYSCYGRKVETAIDLRKKGNTILIIHENDFWNFYDNYIANYEISKTAFP